MTTCSKVRHLVLDNRFLPPSPFLSMSSLAQITFAPTGTIPDVIWNLREATSMFFGNNSMLIGTLPSLVGLLTNLEYLDVKFTQMNGTLPPSLGLLTSLSWLDLDGTLFTGTVPDELAWLATNHSLEALTMTGSQLSGSVVDALCPVAMFDCEFDALCGCHCSCA